MGNKKCRIYAACGVSQTPRKTDIERRDGDVLSVLWSTNRRENEVLL